MGLVRVFLAQLAEDISKIHTLGTQEKLVYSRSNEYSLAQQITSESVRLSVSQVWMEDVFWVSFNEGWIRDESDFQTLVAFCRELESDLNGFIRSCLERSSV